MTLFISSFFRIDGISAGKGTKNLLFWRLEILQKSR